MPLTGGLADKIGNRYEKQWACKQALLVLSGQLSSVQIEAVGDDEVGVDLWVVTPEGIRQAHQCKRANWISGRWTLGDLKTSSILQHLQSHLKASKVHEFHFVSTDCAPELRDLSEQARRTSDAVTFYAAEVLDGSHRRRRSFTDFCRYLDLQDSNPNDVATAFDYLRRTWALTFPDDQHALTTLRELASRWVEGNPDETVALLESWLLADTNLRQTIRADTIAEYLRSSGHEPRLLSNDSRLWTKIHALQRRFTDSLSPYLAPGGLIPRLETKQLISHVIADDEASLIVLHGEAGVGKSGVLLELTHDLTTLNIPFLPLRLDREPPARSAKDYARRSLDLPETPAYCLDTLASQSKCVLILDQLDAVHWTSSNSAEAWECTLAIIDEAQRLGEHIRVIVCCRSFDLDHDLQIRTWVQEQRAKRLKIHRLSEEAVEATIQQAGQTSSSLSKRQLDLLRNIQSLSLWLQVVAHNQSLPSFETSFELMDRYWETRSDALRARLLDPDRAFNLLDLIANYLEEAGRQWAPRDLVSGDQNLLDGLQSVGVIAIQANRIVFSHQTYLDDRLARHITRSLIIGDSDLLTVLRRPAGQDLFRREQLRLILTRLRSQDASLYAGSLRKLLQSEEIRFHLKHAALQLVGVQESLIPEEKAIVLKLLQDHYWIDHVLDLVVFGHPIWFRVLAEMGIVQSWLDSSAGSDSARAQQLLRAFSAAEGEIVAEFIRPFLDEGEDGKRLANEVLPRQPERDSPSIFSLRLQLEAAGYAPHYRHWEGIAQASFPRLKALLRVVLTRILQQCRQDPDHLDRLARSPKWHGLEAIDLHEANFHDLIDLMAFGPEILWEIRQAGKFAKHCDPDTIQAGDIREEWLDPLFQLLVKAAQSLIASEAPAALAALYDQPLNKIRALVFFQAAKSTTSRAAADSLLQYLMDNPAFLRLRYRRDRSHWESSAELISAMSPICSQEVLERLTNYLLDFRDPDLLSHYRYRHEHLMEEFSGKSHQRKWVAMADLKSRFGITPFHLLPSIDQSRLPVSLKSAVNKYLQELERKFVERQEGDLGGGGVVRSPISKNPWELSDLTWLQIIAGNRSTQVIKPARDGFTETSPDAFASDLRRASAAQPERFARLGLKIPATANSVYLRQILSGLHEKNPPSNLDPKLRQVWQRASGESIQSLLELPHVMGDPDAATSCAWLVRDLSDFNWSEQVLNSITWTATTHPDPSPDGAPFVPFDWKSRPERLLEGAMNCARGVAALAIAELLRSEPARGKHLHGAVTSLFRDPNPSVRTGSLFICHSLYLTDRERALDCFIDAVSDAPDQLLVTRGALPLLWDQIDCIEDVEGIAQLVRRMLNSDSDVVASEGARLIAATYLKAGGMEPEFHQCKQGNVRLRKGVAWLASHWLAYPEVQNRCCDLVLHFANDPELEVAKTPATAAREWDLESLLSNSDFLIEFILSPAFRSNPEPLVHNISNRYTGSLLPIGHQIIQMVQSISTISYDDPNDQARTLSGLTHDLLPVLLRLYQETTESESDNESLREECLDAWDLLLEKRIGFAHELTKAVDSASTI